MLSFTEGKNAFLKRQYFFANVDATLLSRCPVAKSLGVTLHIAECGVVFKFVNLIAVKHLINYHFSLQSIQPSDFNIISRR